ncbi:hypothetical protein [Flindersiella endophytica]
MNARRTDRPGRSPALEAQALIAVSALAGLAVAGCSPQSPAKPEDKGPVGNQVAAAARNASLSDGYVGAPQANGSGVVEVRTAGSDGRHVLAPPDPQAGERFGAAVFSGPLDEVDHNGPSFLLVGAPGLDVGGRKDAGGVYVFEQAGKTYRFVDVVTQDDVHVRMPGDPGDTPAAPGRVQAGAEFGAALAGEVNEDSGATQVSVGVPGLDVGDARAAGGVFVLDFTKYVGGQFYGSVKTVNGALYTLDLKGSPREAQAGDRLGTTVSNQMWGAPGATLGGQQGAGLVVYVNRGSPARPPKYWIFQLGTTGLPGKPAAGDGFGSSFLRHWDDATMTETLWIGVPGRDVDGVRDAGQIVTLRATQSGRTWVWHAGRTYSENDVRGQRADSGDRFGTALCRYEHYDKRPISSGSKSVHPTATLLLAGAPGEDAGSGAVLGLLDAPTLTAETVGGHSAAGAGFGAQLACGSGASSDGDELVIGVPGSSGTSRNAGWAAHGVHRHGSGPITWDRWTPEHGAAGDRYGQSVTVRGPY